MSVTRRVVPVAPGRLVSRVGPQAGLERGGRRHPGRPAPQGLNSIRQIYLSMRMVPLLRESRRVHASWYLRRVGAGAAATPGAADRALPADVLGRPEERTKLRGEGVLLPNGDAVRSPDQPVRRLLPLAYTTNEFSLFAFKTDISTNCWSRVRPKELQFPYFHSKPRLQILRLIE